MAPLAGSERELTSLGRRPMAGPSAVESEGNVRRGDRVMAGVASSLAVVGG
jgi:hypothetical protein